MYMLEPLNTNLRNETKYGTERGNMQNTAPT